MARRPVRRPITSAPKSAATTRTPAIAPTTAGGSPNRVDAAGLKDMAPFWQDNSVAGSRGLSQLRGEGSSGALRHGEATPLKEAHRGGTTSNVVHDSERALKSRDILAPGERSTPEPGQRHCWLGAHGGPRWPGDRRRTVGARGARTELPAVLHGTPDGARLARCRPRDRRSASAHQLLLRNGNDRQVMPPHHLAPHCLGISILDPLCGRWSVGGTSGSDLLRNPRRRRPWGNLATRHRRSRALGHDQPWSRRDVVHRSVFGDVVGRCPRRGSRALRGCG